jgi:hypothetical protein
MEEFHDPSNTISNGKRAASATLNIDPHVRLNESSNTIGGTRSS